MSNLPQIKRDIDQLWTEFWTGGITNPLTVIEQISFLMFARLLDVNEARNEKMAARTKKEWKRVFSAKQQHLRWSNFSSCRLTRCCVWCATRCSRTSAS
jgi:type I restriction enzyme M protein